MCQRCPLGEAGGAARKLNIDRIVGLQSRPPLLQGVTVGAVAHFEHLFERTETASLAGADADQCAQCR
jgi:hypothetical protein